MGIKLPERTYELIADVANLYPQIEIDKNLEPSTITIRSHFRDPLPMLPMFTHKELPSSWTGTSDTITANFSDLEDVDNNLGMQLRIPDPSGNGNHVDLFFDGGKITEYRWVGEAQSSVKEEIDIKFAEVTENTQAIDVDDGLDDGAFDSVSLVLDGGWLWWDRTTFSTARKVLLTKDVTVTIGGSAPVGLHIQSFTLTLTVPQTYEFIQSSMVAGIQYEEVRGPWKLELMGKLQDNQAISEALATLASKTKATAKLEYNSSPLDKYFQFTNSVLKNINGISMPTAGKPIDVTYEYEGAGASVLTYKWIGSESTDPSNYIEHTDV